MILVVYARWLVALFGRRVALVSCRSQMRTAGDNTFDRAAVSFLNTAPDIVASSNQIKTFNLAPFP